MPITLKLAIRSLRRSPSFSLLAIAMLSIGIGATTAMFGITNTVLLKPLPYRDPEQLITVLFRIPSFSKQVATVPVNAQHYQLWRDHSRTLQEVGIVGPTSAILSGNGESEHVTGARVSANLLHLLGTEPAIGRNFAQGEDQAGHSNVVIVSNSFWRSEVGGRSDILGKRSYSTATHTALSVSCRPASCSHTVASCQTSCNCRTAPNTGSRSSSRKTT